MAWASVTNRASARGTARVGLPFGKKPRAARIDAHTVRSVALKKAKSPPGFQGRRSDTRRALARVGDRTRNRGWSGDLPNAY